MVCEVVCAYLDREGFETFEAADGARVTVLDDGPGFDPEFIDHAFDSFSRPDTARARADGGSGLGLAIAKGFVVALGREISARPGPGGAVSFTLP